MTATHRALPRFAAVSTIIATLCATASCDSTRHAQGSPTPTARASGWPTTLNDFTVVWTAEPGIDVTTGPVVAVRAYAESYLLASITGDNRYLYPGFQQSVDPNQSCPLSFYLGHPWSFDLRCLRSRDNSRWAGLSFDLVQTVVWRWTAWRGYLPGDASVSVGSSSAIRARTRLAMSSRMTRTVSRGWPAGSASFQSR